MADDLAAVVGQFFACLRGRLNDRLRDLTLCRQRLRHMQDTLSAVDDGDEPVDGGRPTRCGPRWAGRRRRN